MPPPPSATPDPGWTRCDWWLGALLLVTVLAVYWPALHGGLLLDDVLYVTPVTLRSWHGLWRIWFAVGATARDYYPLLHSVLWVEHCLWGDTVTGYHLASALQHAGSALLVVAIVHRLQLPGAWLAGFLFALHPVCVESVAWMAEQKNTLSTVCFLGSLFVYLRYDQERRLPVYFLALSLFVLALLSKQVTATLPAALLVVFWWQRGRIGWKRDVWPLLPWMTLGVAAGLLCVWGEQKLGGAEGADFAWSPGQHILVAGRAIWFYFGKLVWPADLAFVYPRWMVDTAVGWQWLFPLGLLPLVAGLVWLSRKNRAPLAAFLLFTGMLSPVMGFLNIHFFVFSYVADHFQYLPMLGLIVPASAGLSLAWQRLPVRSQRWAPVAAAGLLAVLGTLAWRQAGCYRDNETLSRATLAHNPDCWLAHNDLGHALMFNRPGQEDEAIRHFKAAIQLRPDYSIAHSNLGNSYALIPGRMSEAIAEYEIALRFSPDYLPAHLNLGNALASSGRKAEAIAQWEIVLARDPDNITTLLNLGLILGQIPERRHEARPLIERALRLAPDDARARRLLDRLNAADR